MSRYIDYFKQITRGEILTKEILEKRYNEFLNFIYKSKVSDIERTQELIQLRFDFLIAKELLENYRANMSHKEMKEKYLEIEVILSDRKQKLSDNAKIRKEKINPYRNLIIPQNAEEYQIRNLYESRLKDLEQELKNEEELNNGINNVIDIYAHYMLYVEAAKILLDKKLRRKIDEEISLGYDVNLEKQENVQIFNLKYNQINNKSIAYELKNRYGDIIRFEHIGYLEYTQFGKKSPIFKDRETLQRFIVHKIYNSMKNMDGTIPERKFDVFTYLNINQMSLDEDFKAAHADILFSDVNLENAVKYNGGYIGEIEYENGEIKVFHEADKLCACRKYYKKD